MLDFNVVSAIGIIVVLLLIYIFVLPYLKAKGMQSSIYKDIKMGLLVFGYAFRDDKVKKMVDMLYGIVASIESLDIAPEDKKDKAVRVAFDNLLAEFEIVLDEEVISLIIDIAVAYLPPTNPVTE